MPQPKPVPKPGSVVVFPYLWKAEADAGHEMGKLRPCVVVGATRHGDTFRLSVVPITHTVQFEAHLPIPANYAKDAGLDGHDNHVVTEEMNTFTWPSKDTTLTIWPVGSVPEGFYDKIKGAMRDVHALGQLDAIDRDALAREIVENWRERGG